jgi:hypothetical protein
MYQLWWKSIVQWIFINLGTYIVLRRVWNPIDFQGEKSRGQLLTAQHPCEHSRINILQWILNKLGQGCYAVKIRTGELDLWLWKSIRFQTLIRTMYVSSLVKIHWRMLILECSQGCYASISYSDCPFIYCSQVLFINAPEIKLTATI